MARPSNLPEWDTTEVEMTEPPSDRKLAGWAVVNNVPEKPPFRWFNYMWNLYYKWIKHLDEDKVNKTGNETIAGIKTFSSFPVTPSSEPTSDYDVANKKYVNDSAGIDIASTAEAQAGTDNTKAITSLRLHESMLGGVEQSWQDVANSRASGTTYTNTTGKPIFIAITVSCNDTEVATLAVNGIDISEVQVAEAGATRASQTAIVQNGETYKCTWTGAMTHWTELR